MIDAKPVADMERSVGALALELPAEVWGDVRDKWTAARNELVAEGERLQAVIAKEADLGIGTRPPTGPHVVVWGNGSVVAVSDDLLDQFSAVDRFSIHYLFDRREAGL